MSAMLFVAALDVKVWVDELALQGIRIADGRPGAKLKEEAHEFYEDPTLEEAADCFIALLGAVASQGWTQDQLATAVTAKMKVNRARTWKQRDDGTYHHV